MRTHSLEYKLLVLSVLGLSGLGCAGTGTALEDAVPASVMEEPAPLPIVAPPLPGVDAAVIESVAASYDSTFVPTSVEREASLRFVEGRAVQERLDSLLTQLHGAGPLDGQPGSLQDAADSTALLRAQQKLAAAAQAQTEQDSAQVLVLLQEAQHLFEEVLRLNPFDDDARYQLLQVYKIQAQRYSSMRNWESVLHVLRGLLKLNADQHVFWADMAGVLETMERFEASGLAYMQAAVVVKDDALLAFASEPPAVDSLTLFRYYQRAYSVFARNRDGVGAQNALSEAMVYATDSTQHAYAVGELDWVRWDGDNFENRLRFDSLQAVASEAPAAAVTGLGDLIGQLTLHAARLEASYNYAVLTWQQEDHDRALDTLQALWNEVGTHTPLPYGEYTVDLLEAYATMLFQRGLQHRQAGATAKAFTYLLMVAELGSQYTGPALIEALKLTRNNPRQGQQLEDDLEAVFDSLSVEDKRTYLSLMGNLYRRIGDVETAQHFARRFAALGS